MTPDQRRSWLIKLLSTAALRVTSMSDNDGREATPSGEAPSGSAPPEDTPPNNKARQRAVEKGP